MKSSLLRTATKKLVAAAKEPDAPGALRQLRELRIDDALTYTVTDARGRAQRLPAEAYVQNVLRPLVDVEGSALFDGIEGAEWVSRIAAKIDFCEDIDHAYYSAAEMGEDLTIDRDDPQWTDFSRRNVTVPYGLAYEATAILNRLHQAKPPVKISFSGLIDVALRELFSHPINDDDARATSEPTIAEMIAKHGVGARRKIVRAS